MKYQINGIVGTVISGNAKVGKVTTNINGQTTTIINGGTTIIDGKGTTIINGQIVGNPEMSRLQKIDERKVIKDTQKIKKIKIISSDIDIVITASKCSKDIEAHLSGEVYLPNEAVPTNAITLDMHQVGSELEIATTLNVSHFNGRNLNLHVTVPNQYSFELLSFETTSGDITIKEGITAATMNITTHSGDITIEDDVVVSKWNVQTTSGDINYRGNRFDTMFFSTTSGDIELDIDAVQDITMGIFTTSGDVSARLNHIKKLNLSMKTTSGDTCKHTKYCLDGHTANVTISTTSGDIELFAN